MSYTDTDTDIKMDMESDTGVEQIYEVAASRVMRCSNCGRHGDFIEVCCNQCTYSCIECFGQFRCKPVLDFFKFREYLTSYKHQHYTYATLDRFLEVHNNTSLNKNKIECICDDLKKDKYYKDYLLYKLLPNLFEEDISEPSEDYVSCKTTPNIFDF